MDSVPAVRFEDQGSLSTRHEALVVGGGLAGSALAIELARAGRSVVLFEREMAAHDKVCGEFISHEGAHYLARLGVDLSAMGSVPISHVRVVRNGAPVTARLPFLAQSLSRKLLDEKLLGIASDAGVEIRRGVRIKTLTRDGEGWTASFEGGAAQAADAFLATGKHDIAGWKRPQGVQGDLIGLKSYWRLTPEQTAALRDHVELILFSGGYAGLQCVEGGVANLCLLVRKSAYADLYKTYDGLLDGMTRSCPHLRSRLSGAERFTGKPLAITALPYGYVARDPDGPWRLGDQAAVIPSFSGDGMSIALHSAQLAARTYLSGGAASAYHKQIEKDVSAQVARATLVSRVLVTRAGQYAAMGCARLAPFAVKSLAALTRIPDRALQQANPAN